MGTINGLIIGNYCRSFLERIPAWIVKQPSPARRVTASSSSNQNPQNQHNHMSHTPSEPTHHEIAVCAYCIWEQEGRPEGRTLDHWLQAQLQLVFASIWQKGATAQKKEIPAKRSHTSKMLSLLELPARSPDRSRAVELSPTLL